MTSVLSTTNGLLSLSVSTCTYIHNIYLYLYYIIYIYVYVNNACAHNFSIHTCAHTEIRTDSKNTCHNNGPPNNPKIPSFNDGLALPGCAGLGATCEVLDCGQVKDYMNLDLHKTWECRHVTKGAIAQDTGVGPLRQRPTDYTGHKNQITLNKTSESPGYRSGKA